MNGVGFSKGCAELALKKPPPLVPSILIASCEATGPCAMSLLEPLDARHLGVGVEVLRHALPDEEEREDDADRQQDVEHAARQVHPEVAQMPARCGA